MNKDIRNIQQILLDMYRELDKLCEKYDLKIFLTGGSVLGAIRHKGFIPWDDDMDVALPRDDYEKLIGIAEKELPEHLKIVWISRPFHYRLIDTRYELKLNTAYSKLLDSDEQAFISIDIQPFDGVPKGLLGKMHSLKTLAFRACYKMCSPDRIIYDESWREGWETRLLKLLKHFKYLFKNEEIWKKRFDKAMKQYDYKLCGNIADYVGKYKFKDIYPKNWWEPGQKVEFENIRVLVPSEYDRYLKAIYGDYMKLPPERERIVHREEK